MYFTKIANHIQHIITHLAKLVDGLDESPTVMVQDNNWVRIGAYLNPDALSSRPIIIFTLNKKLKNILI
jgi:hypothetical protein